MPEILTTEELAKLLKIDVVTLRKMANRGEFPAFKLGSEYRFTREDIDEFIKENRVARQEVKS